MNSAARNRWSLAPAAVMIAVILTACGGPTSAPSATSGPPTDMPVVTAAPPEVVFLPGDLRVVLGECTDLEWRAEGALKVYLDGRGVDPVGSTEVCPTTATTYTLDAVLPDGTRIARNITIAVTAPGTTATAPPTAAPSLATRAPATVTPTATATPAPTQQVVIEFYPDNHVYELPKDQSCTAVNWRVTGVTNVQLEREGLGRKDVENTGQEEVCFSGRLKYYLYFRLPDGRDDRREIELRHQS